MEPGQFSSEVLAKSSDMSLKTAKERAEVEITLARGRAEALLLVMEAEETYLSAIAGAVESLNAADNTLTPEIINMRLKLALLQKLPDILKASDQSLEELLPHLKTLII
jgi:uncharacterized membrane protein YqiK